jgi:hypothetical protein
MKGITPFSSGRPLLSEVTADKLNAILSEIKRNRPVVASPLSARVTGDGTHISIKVPPGGSSTPTTPQPWDIIATPDPESESENPPYLARVRPGTLSGFLPTNWGDEFTLQGDEDYYAVAEVSTDGKAITSVEIKFETSAPEPQQPELFAVPSPVKVIFGIFSQGMALRTIAAGDISVQPRVWFQEARTNVAAGESLFNLYYVLAP